MVAETAGVPHGLRGSGRPARPAQDPSSAEPAMTASTSQPDPPPQVPAAGTDAGDEPLDVVALEAAGFGTVRHLAETDSTMHDARLLAACPDVRLPAVVIADRQPHGRGRRGARWWQPPGSLAASLVLVGSDGGTPPPTVSLACGVALAETLAILAPGSDPQVCWPNDVVSGGRKLAGILVESAPHGRIIFGVGVNTTGRATAAPDPLQRRLVTLPDLVGASLCRTRLLAAFLPRLLATLATLGDDPPAVATRYRDRCGLTGRAVTLHLGDTACHGICRGVATDGALLLETADGVRRFVSGSLTAPDDVWRG
jgi:BirA family biotin operon repressor/biotin-[acetyl-CoA-carboxylase] ligase